MDTRLKSCGGVMTFNLRKGMILMVFLLLWGAQAYPFGDSIPWTINEFYPMIDQGPALGYGGASTAWNWTASSALVNPATLLSFPAMGIELGYRGIWRESRYRLTDNAGTDSQLGFYGLKLAGSGAGLLFFRSTPMDQDLFYTYNGIGSPAFAGSPPGGMNGHVKWKRTGLMFALRLQYDFVVGIGIARESLSLSGSAFQASFDGSKQWDMTYQLDAKDWTFAFGVQWWLTQDIQVGVSYLINPVVRGEATVQETSFEEEGVVTSTTVVPFRFGYPNMLNFGAHIRENRFHLFLEARRYKTGRMNKDPWVRLFTLSWGGRLEYENTWEYRFGFMYEAVVFKVPLYVKLGAWKKPLWYPVWKSEAPEADVSGFSATWPPLVKKWHGTAGLSIGLQPWLELHVSGVFGPTLKGLYVNVATLFR